MGSIHWKRRGAGGAAATRWVALGAALCLALGLAACGGSKGNEGGGTDQTLRYGSLQDLISLDPVKGTQTIFLRMVYDNLVRYDADGKIVGDLASSYRQVSPTEYEFTLRTGVTYQDGSAFTADTAKQSLERSIAAGGPRASSLAAVQAIEATDATTLKITLKRPSPALLDALAQAPGCMVSPKAFDRTDLATNPDGTGGYVYDAAHSVTGDHYTFTAKDKWWDADNTPRPKTVVFKVLVDDTARLNALKTGQVDIVVVTATQAAEAKDSGLSVASKANTWIGLTILDRKGTLVPALGSVKVRQAMVLALDRVAMVKALSFGYGEPSSQVFGKGTQGYDPNLDTAYAYDLARAQQLVTESGFKNITFTVPVPAIFQAQAEAIKAQFAKIGITMKLQLMPNNALAAAARTTKFPVLMFPFPNNSPYSRYAAQWAPKAGFNPFKVDDPKLDALAAQLAVATDPDEQNRIAMQINEEVVSTGIAIVLQHPDDLAAYSPKLKGVHMSIYLTPELRGVHFQ